MKNGEIKADSMGVLWRFDSSKRHAPALLFDIRQGGGESVSLACALCWDILREGGILRYPSPSTDRGVERPPAGIPTSDTHTPYCVLGRYPGGAGYYDILRPVLPPVSSGKKNKQYLWCVLCIEISRGGAGYYDILHPVLTGEQDDLPLVSPTSDTHITPYCVLGRYRAGGRDITISFAQYYRRYLRGKKKKKVPIAAVCSPGCKVLLKD